MTLPTSWLLLLLPLIGCVVASAAAEGGKVVTLEEFAASVLHPQLQRSLFSATATRRNEKVVVPQFDIAVKQASIVGHVFVCKFVAKGAGECCCRRRRVVIVVRACVRACVCVCRHWCV
jgi:hypothetical protein